MGNTFGKLFRLTTFGESHGKALGAIVDGCPAGLDLDLEKIRMEMQRRKPGQSKITTQRKEEDEIELLSGVFEGINTSSYTAGDILYVANGGGLTDTIPTGGSGAVAVVAKSHSSTGIIIVGQPKGNGTWGALKNGLA